MHFQYDRNKDIDKRYIGFTLAAAAGMTAVAAGAAVGTAATLTTAGLVVGAGITAATVGAAAWGMSSMMKPKSQSMQALPAPPDVKAAEAAAAADIDKKRRSQARNKTTYTSPLGLKDEEKSGVATKTLLGE